MYPGSHTDAQVGPERAPHYSADAQRHGEYIPAETVASLARGAKRPREAVDAAVPEGTAILFDANLLHAAHPHVRRSVDDEATSERVAFHYIPTSHVARIMCAIATFNRRRQ